MIMISRTYHVKDIFCGHVRCLLMISRKCPLKDIFWTTFWIYLHYIPNISTKRYLLNYMLDICSWYPENILWKISFGRHVEYIFMISQTYSQKDIFWETCWIYLHDIKNISSRRYISKIYLMYIIVIYSRDMTCFEQDPDIKRYPKYISCLLGICQIP